MSAAQSPYEVVLGDRFGELHPKLREYFSAIEEENIGVGEGVFDVVGARRSWVRLGIRMFAPKDVLFAVWAHAVPFTVINTRVPGARSPAVSGERIFRFTHGDSVMHDLITATADGLVDVLGRSRRIRALFTADIVDGELRLVSTRIVVRAGGHHWRIPGPVAPRVSLIERYSEKDERQHVAVTVVVPIIGTVYEYSGSFRYGQKAKRP